MTAEEVGQKIAALNAERVEQLAAADQYEKDARAARARALACKVESAEWNTTLNSIKVKAMIVSDQLAAAAARAEAEKHAADLAKMKEDVAAELAKLKAATTE